MSRQKVMQALKFIHSSRTQSVTEDRENGNGMGDNVLYKSHQQRIVNHKFIEWNTHELNFVSFGSGIQVINYNHVKFHKYPTALVPRWIKKRRSSNTQLLSYQSILNDRWKVTQSPHRNLTNNKRERRTIQSEKSLQIITQSISRAVKCILRFRTINLKWKLSVCNQMIDLILRVSLLAMTVWHSESSSCPT